MLARPIELPFIISEQRVLAVLMVLVLAPLGGRMATGLSPTEVLFVPICVAGAAWLIRAGRFSIMIVYCLLSGLYTELSGGFYSPPISIAGNSLQYLDILLVVSLLLWLGSPECRSWSRGPQVLLPLFVGWTLCVGLLLGIMQGTDYHVLTREARSIAWFIFPLTLSGVLTNKARVLTAARVLLITGVGVAAMAAFVRLFHSTLIPQTNLLSYQSYGVRVFQVDGVERATYATALALGFLLAKDRLWLWVTVAANALTLIVALTRGAYLATLVATVVMHLALGAKKVPRLLVSMAAIATMIFTAVTLLNISTGENVGAGFFDRLSEIDQLESGTGSVQTRFTEWDVVWSYLTARPESLVVGLGLGGTFADPRNLLQSDGAEVNLRNARFSYVHNGFLWFILRGGFVGMLLLYAFCAIFIGRCLLLARRTVDGQLRGLLLGVAGIYVAVLVLSWSGSPLSEGMRMSVLMAYAALGLAAIRLVESMPTETPLSAL